MKRTHAILAIVLVAVMLLALIPGCGETATPTPTAKPAAATPTKAAAATTPAAAATAAPAATATPAVLPSGVGFTSKEILIGQTLPLSGPVAAVGVIGKSSGAYFKYVNEMGGVNGRTIVHKMFDDQYSPPKTVEGTKQLVETDKVLLMYLGVGTAAQRGVVDYLNEKKVPQLFVASGVQTFGGMADKYPWTTGGVISYLDESAILAKYIVTNKPAGKLGVLYQNDDMGKEYIQGFKTALGAKSTMIVGEQSYEATAADLNSQVQNLKASGADTLVIFALPAPAAKAISSADTLGWAPLIVMANPGVSQASFDAITSKTKEGVISCFYYKDPSDPSLAEDAGIKLFKAQMAKYNPEGDVKDIVNLGGFAFAHSLVELLKAAGTNPTRENVMNAAYTLNVTNNPFFQTGIAFKMTKTDLRPLKQVRMVKFTNNRFTPFGDLVSAN